jgi:hypothetical protein
MATTRTSCIACGAPLSRRGYSPTTNPDGRALEHALPAWLQSHLGIAYQPLNHRHQGFGPRALTLVPEGEVNELRIAEKSSTRTLLSDSWRHGSVCGPCNGGWMSTLESSVKPVLCPLMDGQSALSDLSGNESELLTRWLLKTAFFMCDSSAGPTIIPPSHMQLAMRGELPDGLSLLGSKNPSAGVYGFHADRHWLELQPLDWPSPNLESHAQRSYKFSLMLGCILLSLVYWPPLGTWNLALTSGLHEEVWPCTRERIVIPWSMHFPVTPHVLLVFHFATGVTERSSWTTSIEVLDLPNGTRPIFAHELVHMNLVHFHSINGCPYFDPSQTSSAIG